MNRINGIRLVSNDSELLSKITEFFKPLEMAKNSFLNTFLVLMIVFCLLIPERQVYAQTVITSLPYEIRGPGTYHLVDDLKGISGKDGIVIWSSDVTLDLNGFTLKGGPGSKSAIRVWFFTPRFKNITIKNGSIYDWGEDGVHAIYGNNIQIEDLFVWNTGRFGIVTGEASTVINSKVTNASADGFIVGDNSIIKNLISSNNKYDGISTGSNSIIENCISNNNGDDGFTLDKNSTAIHLTADANNYGIVVLEGSIVESSTASNNEKVGISAGIRATIRNCTVLNNQSHGIEVQSDSIVENCLVAKNQLSGIIVTSNSMIVGNECSSNGNGPRHGVGIYVIGEGNRIEDNVISNNDLGITGKGKYNFIVRNFACRNGDYGNPIDDFDIDQKDNFVGPIRTKPVGFGTWSYYSTPWDNFPCGVPYTGYATIWTVPWK